VFEEIPRDHDQDVFELTMCNGQVVIRGNHGVSMAMNGINVPLSVTGQEATWQAARRRLGLGDGPA
jgi:hypothetical protein